MKDSYVYSLNRSDRINDEMEALNKIGAEFEFEKSVDLPFTVAGAIKFKNQAQFNPIMFLSGMVKDLNIYENSRVLKIQNNTAVCENGSVKAEKIIITTHFPFIDKYGL